MLVPKVPNKDTLELEMLKCFIISIAYAVEKNRPKHDDYCANRGPFY